MFEKALVPLDGSELAEGILPYVSQLMKGLDGSIVLLLVIDPDAVELPGRLRQHIAGLGAGSIEMAIAPTEESTEHVSINPRETAEVRAMQVFDSNEVLEEAKRGFDEVLKRLSNQGVHAELVVAFGRPAETIARVADEKGCDVIAISTHGRNALARGILGSVTDKIIHLAHRPTLTITPERAKQYWEEGETIDRIMVPLDGSPLAESVLPYVEFLAERLSLEIVLVRVLNFVSMYTPGLDAYFGADDLEAEIEIEATKYLETVSQRLKAKSLKVEWKLLRGHPAVAIVDLARETPHNIIALTSHGRSGVTRWVIGSVANTLVRASGDPVLMIPTNPQM